jgi:putative cell wall-binding protein
MNYSRSSSTLVVPRPLIVRFGPELVLISGTANSVVHLGPPQQHRLFFEIIRYAGREKTRNVNDTSAKVTCTIRSLFGRCWSVRCVAD